MEVRPGTLGFPEIQASGNLLDRERRLLPQARCQRQLGRVALRPGRHVALRPLQPGHFLRHDPVGLGSRGFEPGLAWVVFPHFALHLLKAFPPESLAADRPSLPKLLEGCLVHLFKPTTLHVALKLLPACRCVVRNAVLTQQAAGSQFHSRFRARSKSQNPSRQHGIVRSRAGAIRAATRQEMVAYGLYFLCGDEGRGTSGSADRGRTFSAGWIRGLAAGLNTLRRCVVRSGCQRLIRPGRRRCHERGALHRYTVHSGFWLLIAAVRTPGAPLLRTALTASNRHRHPLVASGPDGVHSPAKLGKGSVVTPLWRSGVAALEDGAHSGNGAVSRDVRQVFDEYHAFGGRTLLRPRTGNATRIWALFFCA